MVQLRASAVLQLTRYGRLFVGCVLSDSLLGDGELSWFDGMLKAMCDVESVNMFFFNVYGVRFVTLF